MIKKIKKFKKIRIHHEGTDTLLYSFIAYAALALLLFRLDNKLFFWSFLIIFGLVSFRETAHRTTVEVEHNGIN